MVELKAHEAKQTQERLPYGRAYQDYSRVLCLADGRPLKPWNFMRPFNRPLRQAGVLHVRFQDAYQDARYTLAILKLKIFLRRCKSC
jgi:hypothetical protein